MAIAYLPFFIFAQQKHLSIESAVLGYSKGLYPQSMQQLQWISGVDIYFYAENNAFFFKNPDATLVRQLSFLDLKSVYPTLTRLPYPEKIDENRMLFQTENGYTVFDYINKKQIVQVQFDENAENQDYCLKNNQLAYTIENNLYVADANNPKLIVTDFQDKNIVSGTSIHRSEFGITKGTFWSPNGTYLAFYQKDESNVTEYPLENITTYPSTLNSIKYPMAGQGSEKAKIGIYNTQNKKVSYLNINTNDEHYLTNLAWSPDEKFILIAEINRAQNHYALNVYDVTNGNKVRTILEESNPKWVEPEFPALFLPKSNTTFFWMSEKDGFMNVYQYDLVSNFTKQVTNFKFVVTQILGFDAKNENIFVTATGNDPKGSKVFKINLKNGKVLEITKENGTHYTQLSPSSNYLIDVFTNLNTPNITSIVDLKTLKKNIIFTADNPTKNFRMGSTEFVKLKAEDGQDLESVIIKPANFDPNKKYPVLIYVYGGPHAQLVTDTWLGGTSLWMQYLAAEKDYIVFTLDNRGSSNRGFEFESVLYRQQGKVPMADQMLGVAYLKSLPFVDASRIAVNGWSYGGYMTISLLLNYPDTFTTGVAGGPVTDWKYYEVMYGERYMDTPQENPEGYEATKLHNKISNLKSDLLIIHGSIDDIVVPQHSLTLLKEAVEKGIQLDFFTYPMHAHNVRGKDRVHLQTKMLNYILEHNQ